MIKKFIVTCCNHRGGIYWVEIAPDGMINHKKIIGMESRGIVEYRGQWVVACGMGTVPKSAHLPALYQVLSRVLHSSDHIFVCFFHQAKS